MNISEHIILFQVDDLRFALPIEAVERISRIVEITPLPKAPKVVIGVIDVQGRVIPVVDIRKRFNLTERKMRLTDHIVICNTSKRTVAILVDSVSDIVETDQQNRIAREEILSEMEYLKGVVRTQDGILLVQDLEKLLSFEEEKELERAVEQASSKREKGRRKGKS